jgi:N-acetylmuramoyl-L-alanine amidase
MNPEWTPRTRTDFIAVHCSATKPSQNVDENEIRKWHIARGWSDVGYNIVILRNGIIQIGRPLDMVGAHVEGYNSSALGICLVGGISELNVPENNFTEKQMHSLLIALRFCKLYAPSAKIQGHRDFPNVRKDCPCFDVRDWISKIDPTLL